MFDPHPRWKLWSLKRQIGSGVCFCSGSGRVPGWETFSLFFFVIYHFVYIYIYMYTRSHTADGIYIYIYIYLSTYVCHICIFTHPNTSIPTPSSSPLRGDRAWPPTPTMRRTPWAASSVRFAGRGMRSPGTPSWLRSKVRVFLLGVNVGIPDAKENLDL